MDEVVAYVKNNQNLGFRIPYALEGQPHQYLPDYLLRVREGGPGLLNLIVEVSGERQKDKEAKVDTARNLWVPAVNHDGRFGRWAFLEVRDPWEAKGAIRKFLESSQP
jgi:type III restriction enzyme